MHIMFSHCKHCAKEIAHMANKPVKFCSTACYHASESCSKTARGFMTGVASRQREGQFWKETSRNVDSM